ncbi:MAG: hypothetical protein LBD80_02255 [Tannerella sp.]|jgi:16S rRNA processing protein RimM|nr:hypothetical protein [Tannerella sp.]
MIDKKDLYNAGTFGRPHGVKGEITLVTNCELPDFGKDSPVFCEMDGIPVPFFIESVRPKSAGSVLVKFEDIDSERDVKIFTGKTACLYAYLIKKNEKSKKPAYTGYQIIDENLSFKGVITDVDDSTANILLKADCGGKDIIVPFNLYQHISHTEKIIYMKLPEGFTDI